MEQESFTKYRQPFTNLSINSQAAVLYEIGRKSQVHWLLGLRQAELFIDEKQTALNQAYFKQREYEREIRKKQRELASLQENQAETTLAPDRLDQIEALEDAIAQAAYYRDRIIPQVRDACMELQTAMNARNQILEAHPEASELNYMELQSLFGDACINETLAHYLAGRVWACSNSLTEQIGATLFDHPVHLREQLIQREAELRTNLDLAGVHQQAELILAELPAEKRHQALITAANLIKESYPNG